MKTIIIPVDFSEVSLNAARYAAQMLIGKDDAKIILYHMFKESGESRISGEYLESLKVELLAKGNKNIDCIKEQGEDFIDSLERLAFQKTASLIVMGITGKSAIYNFFIGSNTLKMIERNVCPVFIVPPESTFTKIGNVALTCDFNNVKSSTPTLFIKTVLEFFNPRLHIVNVNSEHYVSITEEFQEKRNQLKEMFKEYNPDFYFLGMYDYYDAIEKFVKDKNIDLIITIPRYHSFFNLIFNKSHTKKLAMHSSVPLLAAHE